MHHYRYDDASDDNYYRGYHGHGYGRGHGDYHDHMDHHDYHHRYDDPTTHGEDQDDMHRTDAYGDDAHDGDDGEQHGHAAPYDHYDSDPDGLHPPHDQETGGAEAGHAEGYHPH